MCLLTLSPRRAFNAFTTQMTKGGLIQAICSSMSFAFVMTYTKCDAHLVKILSAFMCKLALLLIPLASFIMAAITRTGDATTFAFNQAVTANAAEIDLDPVRSGAGTMYSAIIGRGRSPLAGAAIVCIAIVSAGLAGINSIEIVKRIARA